MITTFTRNRMLLLILLLTGVLVLAACGGGGDAADDSEPQTSSETSENADAENAEETDDTDETEAETDDSEDASESDEADSESAEEVDVTADPDVVASTFPCQATVREDQGTVLQINHNMPSESAPVIRASRGGQEVTLAELIENEEGYFYRVTANNRTQGYSRPFFMVLGDDCNPVPLAEGTTDES